MILRAALAIIGERGPDAVTHRAVAERAGLPLSATTYWFDSKDALLQEALLLSAREEVERIERVVVELAARELEVSEWAAAVAGALASDLESDPAKHVAFTELVLEGTRRPWLRDEIARWEEAQLRLAEMGLRAIGSPEPEADARIVMGAITGLMLGQLANPLPEFEDEVFRPALERLFRLLMGTAAPPAHAPR